MYLVLISTGLASSTISSRAVIEPLRLVSLAALLLFVGLLATNRRFLSKFILPLAIFLMVLAYGLMRSSWSAVLNHVASTFIVDSFLIVSAIFLLSGNSGPILSVKWTNWYVKFCLTIFVITILIGGFAIIPIPQFSFEFYSASFGPGVDQVYSQGISRFYGVASVLSAFLTINTPGLRRPLLWGTLSLLFILLSILGGARGDSMAAVIVVMLALTNRPSGRFVAFVGIALAFAAWFLFGEWIEDLVLFARLGQLSDGLGVREQIWSNAISLLFIGPENFFFGCGFGCFQQYFGYPTGWHPHNFFLELAITIGFPLSALLLFLAVRGFILDMGKFRPEKDAFPWLLAYLILVHSKSESLTNSWLLVAAMIYFSSRTVYQLVVRHQSARQGLFIDNE